MQEAHNQIPSSSISSDAFNQSSSYKTINSAMSDKVLAASPPSIVQTNLTPIESKTVQSTTQFQNSGSKSYNLNFTAEDKIKPNNSVQTAMTFPKSYSPPMNLQQPQNTDVNPQTTTFKGPVRNEPTNTIDLSSLSAVLEEEKSIVVSNDVIEEKSKLSSDHKLQNTSNLFNF